MLKNIFKKENNKSFEIDDTDIIYYRSFHNKLKAAEMIIRNFNGPAKLVIDEKKELHPIFYYIKFLVSEFIYLDTSQIIDSYGIYDQVTDGHSSQRNDTFIGKRLDALFSDFTIMLQLKESCSYNECTKVFYGRDCIIPSIDRGTDFVRALYDFGYPGQDSEINNPNSSNDVSFRKLIRIDPIGVFIVKNGNHSSLALDLRKQGFDFVHDSLSLKEAFDKYFFDGVYFRKKEESKDSVSMSLNNARERKFFNLFGLLFEIGKLMEDYEIHWYPKE